jgi:lysine 2,3-aminomutase
MDQQGLANAPLRKTLASLPRPTLRHIDDLRAQNLLHDAHDPQSLADLSARYTIAMTSHIADQIDRNNLMHDPVALQFVPDAQELQILPQEEGDPIGDYNHAPLKALVHRHPRRVLLKPTQICAVYCRFCFRRDMIGPQGDTITAQDVEDAVDYIRQHSEIHEVILTGGDPFVLSASRMEKLIKNLSDIPHLKWIRVHTRVPVVQPEKINEAFLKALNTHKKLIIAIHANHAREFTPEASRVLNALHQQGALLVSQSVLLKHINDNVESLADLMQCFMDHHIKPYYLHHTDLTRGTQHFRVSLKRGMELMNALRQRVSGLCMPHYVLDIPGGVSKIPIHSDYVRAVHGSDRHYNLHAPDGSIYPYEDLAA